MTTQAASATVALATAALVAAANPASVKITPSKKGAIITPYKNKPEYGFLQLSSTTMRVKDGWLNPEKRSCLLRAKIADLKAFVGMYPTMELPGKIHVREYVASEVPAEVKAKFYNKEKSEAENVDAFAKTTGGKDALELTLEGEQVLRFSVYDPSGEGVDTFVQHDNQEAVREHMARQKDAAAAAVADLEGATTVGKTK